MEFISKQILFKCDYIGPIPQFQILGYGRYKSIFSSLLSILLVFFSTVFFIYSFVEYLNQNPKIEYFKNNDYSTNKTFVISDSLLMFHYFFICSSNLTLEPDILIYSKAENYAIQDYTLEPCQLGKNINLKYKEVIEKFEKVERWKLEDFYCINFNGSNFTLYSHPSLAHELEPSLTFKMSISSKCDNFISHVKLVTENDFIDHTKLDNPIVPYYQKNEFSLLNEDKNIVYNYQFIKYESDNGVFFNDKTTINGIGISGENSFDATDISGSIINIDFKMNSAYYDLYRRTFVKFQSFLADVMSVINLLIYTSKIISHYLLYKKMHKDIIKYIITNNNIKENNKEKQIISNKIKLDKIFDIDENKEEKFEKKINQNLISEEKINSDNSLDIQNKDKDCFLEFENEDTKIIKVMKRLNLINIIKSFLCFKDKKLKLINLCNDIICRDICIERMLKRIYKLESEYKSLIEGDTSQSFINDDISKVKNIIKEISNETDKQI